MDTDINKFGRKSFVSVKGLCERVRKAEKEIQMRQYRGLTKEGKWVYGWYVTVSNTHYIIEDNVAGYRKTDGVGLVIHRAHQVIPETVGQFTGLKDKNGKDLYWWKGDIFARSSDGQIEGSVIYDLGCFWLDRIRGGRTPLYECVDWSMYKIGDIHQNGDLLNGQ